MKSLRTSLFLAQDLLVHLGGGKSAHHFLQTVLNRDCINAKTRTKIIKLLANPMTSVASFSLEEIEMQFWFLVQKGLNGHSVYTELSNFIELASDQLDSLYQKKLALLPLIMSLFLIFFIFPAYMLLLVGPILSGINF